MSQRWRQRIERQTVFDVGEQQLLVLLLVIQPQRDQRRQIGALLDKLHHGGVNLLTPLLDFLTVWA